MVILWVIEQWSGRPTIYAQLLKKFFNFIKSFARTKLSHDKGVKNMSKIIKMSAPMPLHTQKTQSKHQSSFFYLSQIFFCRIQGPREDKLLRAKPKLGYQNKAQDEVKHTNTQIPQKIYIKNRTKRNKNRPNKHTQEAQVLLWRPWAFSDFSQHNLTNKSRRKLQKKKNK